MILKLNSKFYNCENISRNQFPKFEFHIAKEIRKKYNVTDEFFSIAGNVVLVNNQAVRRFVKLINDARPNDKKVKVGEVSAAGLLDEIYHFLFRVYEVHVNPGVIKRALSNLNLELGEDETRKLLFDFVSVFPPLEVFKGQSSAYEYLNSYTADRSNAEITLEEMILLSFANLNPANKNIIELFDKNYLTEKSLFEKAFTRLEKFFAEEKKFGPDNQDLFTFFKMPISQNPDNIEAQLEFIREKWGILLDEKFLRRILSSKDLIREDYMLGGFGGGDAPTIVPKYKGKMSDADFLMLGKSGYKYAEEAWKDYEEPENFTRDIDWMPKAVLMAKNVYVWLDQLSKKYSRHIKTLDQIPDEELDYLARWGFNGLWLIGIWERSNASRKIKHIMGNIDAVASAYSLYDYQIAWDLGGEEAYNNLNHRAKMRGIRLASDMVPNHTGIFSRWVIEHPDYFIQSSHPPFPNYSFNGPDLSDDETVQLKIEDGYWSRSDAAVVFQRIDNRTGEVRYIYHGNDGTNMPWNDTAQLNMLRQDVREAVIQKIFEVARKFSIIRFDAAMTLTKKHFSRLWFPHPGKGGDIPSRSDHSMSQSEFDKLFPVEFWREVVDRINSEMPDTLLLAEAFWLMEGYFVRTLGMHRVYNSAFMHMMMKEENAKYRELISNTLEFEPKILKRYVNFMSNPDEETAIKQFGTGDKYFGVCVMMATLPGLPMFAHGQIEGFHEKYGMEYQRAYYHETTDEWLVDKHKREIFPLLRKRYLFSNVTNFWLYNFIDGYGSLNENVFAFSNIENGERTLVFYNNKYDFTSGKIFNTTSKLVNKNLETRSLHQSLNVKNEQKTFYIFREHISGLEFIRSGLEIARDGFYVELNGFQYLIYLDFREVYDESGEYEKLRNKLRGSGSQSIARSLAEMKLEPVHSSFSQMFEEELLDEFINTCVLNGDEDEKVKSVKNNFIKKKFSKFLSSIDSTIELEEAVKPILANFEYEIIAIKNMNRSLKELFYPNGTLVNKESLKSIIISKELNYRENSILFILWLVVSNASLLFKESGIINRENFIDKFMLDTPIKKILNRLGRSDYEVYRQIILMNILLKHHNCFTSIYDTKEKNDAGKIQFNDNMNSFAHLLEDKGVQEFIGVNEYDGVVYFSKENFEELSHWILTVYLVEKLAGNINVDKKSLKAKSSQPIEDLILQSLNVANELIRRSIDSGYKLEIFKENLSKY